MRPPLLILSAVTLFALLIAYEYLVPHGDEKASDDFYTQLREFSAPFRYDPGSEVHKSF